MFLRKLFDPRKKQKTQNSSCHNNAQIILQKTLPHCLACFLLGIQLTVIVRDTFYSGPHGVRPSGLFYWVLTRDVPF